MWNKTKEFCCSCVFRVIVLMEGDPTPQLVLNRFPTRISIFCAIHLSFYSDQFPSPCWWKSCPQLDATTTVLYCGGLCTLQCVGFAPDMALSWMVKKVIVSLARAQHFLSHVWEVTKMHLSFSFSFSLSCLVGAITRCIYTENIWPLDCTQLGIIVPRRGAKRGN